MANPKWYQAENVRKFTSINNKLIKEPKNVSTFFELNKLPIFHFSTLHWKIVIKSDGCHWKLPSASPAQMTKY